MPEVITPNAQQPASAVVPPKPATTEPAQPNITSSVPDDLVARASAVLPEKKETPKADEVFDRKEYESYLAGIQDPKAKEIMERAYKSLQSGAQKKFQEASELKRQAEATRRRPSVQELLQDPTFVQEAQMYAQQQGAVQAPQGSNLSNEEWSALNEGEKQQIQQMQQQNQFLASQMNQLLSQQEDNQIKERYKNYDSHSVNNVQNDFLNGRVKATREHVWKIIDYEDAVNRAYQLGLQDRQLNLEEKRGASTQPNGINTTRTDEIPERQKNQSNMDYFKELAMNRLKQAQRQ